MRCDNCGWDNADNVTKCIKCNTKLEAAKQSNMRPEANKNPFASTIPDNVRIKDLPVENDKTNHVFPATQIEHEGPSPDEDLVPCPNPECGYLNVRMAKVCPKCKTPLQQKEVALADDEPGKKINDINNTTHVQFTVDAAIKGTIDPYRKSTALKPACGLELVQREGESADDNSLTRKFEFDNEAIVLNRLNLDEDNKSITSKIQAELSYENGKWYLTDKSELKTTFIQVLNKTELKNGDMILMGDRKFIFNQDTQ